MASRSISVGGKYWWPYVAGVDAALQQQIDVYCMDRPRHSKTTKADRVAFLSADEDNSSWKFFFTLHPQYE